MSSSDFTPKNILWGIVGWCMIPLIPIGGFIYLVYKLIAAYFSSEPVQEAKARDKTVALRSTAERLITDHQFPTVEEFGEEVLKRIALGHETFPSAGILMAFLAAAKDLYATEAFSLAELPDAPTNANTIEGGRYRDFLNAHSYKIAHPAALETFKQTLYESLADLSRHLPAMAFTTMERVEATNTPFHIPMFQVLPDVAAAVQALMLPFFDPTAIQIGLFAALREQLVRNQHVASKIPYTPEFYESAKLVMPVDYKGTPEEIIEKYLAGTPLLELFAASVSFSIPQETRFEHHWIVAGSGHGKTQTLQAFIANDLPKVAKGEASIVVIDSQGDLIRNISQLQFFADNPDRLCLIDPTDIEYPVALNLFDIGLQRLKTYSQLDQERLINGVIELYDFVLGALLSAELTQKQSVVFRYITRLMLHIPNANIQTLRELMEPAGFEKYRPHISQLKGTARAFFETEFNSKQFEDTKRQVVRRLWGILENPNFERMFSHPRNKLDLFSEMNSGKVILINTAKELLKQNGTEIFGRFFIAMLAQAAQERATIRDENKRMPTFVYIDECHDYIDNNISLILEQARKFKVGMILAHQYIGQLSPKLQESFAANTSIKFAGGVSDKDARSMAHMLRATPEFIEQQPKLSFAVSIRNFTANAISLAVPFGAIEDMPKASQVDFDALRDRMRERYAIPYSEVEAAISEQLPEISVPVRPENEVDKAGQW